MSGPLASWVLAHTRATNPSERFVLSTLALRANPDGTNASLSVDQLEALTGYHPSTITAALTILRASGELILVRRGSGRGQISRHRIRIKWCADAADCAECVSLGKALSTGLTSANTFKGSDEARVWAQPPRKGSSKARVSRKGSSQTSKGSDETSKGSDEASPYGNGDGPPSGGTVTHPESSAALVPDGTALEPGLENGGIPAEAREAIAAIKASLRRPKHPPTEPRAREPPAA